MTVITPVITGSVHGDPQASQRLLLGPSLGTTAEALWGRCAAMLSSDCHVVAWDLPGHGDNRHVPGGPMTMADLARGVVVLADERFGPSATFTYAGDSVGGAIGLQLMLDFPERVDSAVLMCTGAMIGTPDSWIDRAAKVRASGTVSVVAASRQRWFSSRYLDEHEVEASALLAALELVDAEGYAVVCGAIAEFDVRGMLGIITSPVLAVAGGDDVVTPSESLRDIAEGVHDGRLVILPDVGHLAPAEAPMAVTELIREAAARSAVNVLRSRT